MELVQSRGAVPSAGEHGGQVRRRRRLPSKIALPLTTRSAPQLGHLRGVRAASRRRRRRPGPGGPAAERDLAHGRDPAGGVRGRRLARPAGVHREHEHEVDRGRAPARLTCTGVPGFSAKPRMTGRTCRDSAGQLLQHPVRMPARLGVHGHDRGAGARRPRAGSARLARPGGAHRPARRSRRPRAMNGRADGELRAEGAVHDVHVRPVRAAAEQLELGAEPGQVRGEDADAEPAGRSRRQPAWPGPANSSTASVLAERAESPARSCAARPAPGGSARRAPGRRTGRRRGWCSAPSRRRRCPSRAAAR